MISQWKIKRRWSVADIVYVKAETEQEALELSDMIPLTDCDDAEPVDDGEVLDIGPVED